MAKVTEKDRVARCNRQAIASSKTYKDWEEEWSCNLLEQYYYGKQWAGEDESTLDKRKYVINLFYPSINISKPSMLFSIPKYKVTPRITRIDDPLSDVEARAKLQEDTLNSFVSDPDLGFALEAGLGILDAQFRFAVIQVGYTADFIDNPNAGKPIMVDGEVDQMDESTGQTAKVPGKVPMLDAAGQPVVEANASIEKEGLYLKWISAKQWRTSENSKNKTAANDWVGYFEWHYIEDLKANRRYKNTKDLTATGRMKGAEKDDPDNPHNGMIKVWFRWDLRSKTKQVFPDGGEKFFLEEPFKFLPFACLKFDEILGQWLPLPMTYNWAHPQNELNDTREMQRVHRGRAVRRYLRRTGAFENEEEFKKLCESDDMGSAEVTGDPNTAVVPMQDAPLDAAVMRNVPQSVEDFIRVSGISGESQQIADSSTATQANLIALSGRVRESQRRLQVGQWLSDIGRIMLLTIRDNMALPFVIKMHIDPYSPTAVQEAVEISNLWKEITAEDLGDLDSDVSVDITSLSPIAQEQERSNWITFLGLVTNPTLAPIFAASPMLLRKTAGMFDIHSERDLVELSKAVEAAALMQAQAMAAKAGVSPSGPSSGGAAPGPTPTNNDIAGQLQQQLPAEMVQ